MAGMWVAIVLPLTLHSACGKGSLAHLAILPNSEHVESCFFSVLSVDCMTLTTNEGLLMKLQGQQ